MTALVGRRIVVTGGAGFIGSHLVDELLDRRRAGHVTVVDSLVTGRRAHLARRAEDPRLRFVEADIRSDAGLRALEGVDVVFHLAALGARQGRRDPIENHDVNAAGTLRLLERAHAEGVRRFVHVSTGQVFGPVHRVPVGEHHPMRPATAYGASKLAGEAHVRAAHRAHGLATTVVRPFGTYGTRSAFDGESGEVIPRTIVRNLCGLRAQFRGDDLATRDYLHVADTARALAIIAECDAAVGRALNLGSGFGIPAHAIAETVARLVGRPELAPPDPDLRPDRAPRRVVDGRLLRRLTGFSPAMPFEAGVADLVRWFRGALTTPRRLLARIEETDALDACGGMPA